MFRLRILMFLTCFFCQSSLLLGGWVVSKYSGEFLNTGMGARALGMGSAHTACAGDVTALYWNPAGLHHVNQWQVHAMHSERFGGTVNRDVIGVGIPVAENRGLAVGFMRLGVDDIPFTRLTDPGRPLGEVYVDETGRTVRNVPYISSYVNHSESAWFVSYGVGHHEKWACGINMKAIMKQSGPNDAYGLGFDLGGQYFLSSGLKLGVMLSDITTTLVAWDTGRRELIQPGIVTGAAMPVQIGKFSLLPAADLSVNFENRGGASQLAMGKAGMDFCAGVEVVYQSLLAFRVGSDAGRLAAGAGIQYKGVSLDYGFAPHEDLGSTHRVSISWFRIP